MADLNKKVAPPAATVSKASSEKGVIERKRKLTDGWFCKPVGGAPSVISLLFSPSCPAFLCLRVCSVASVTAQVPVARAISGSLMGVVTRFASCLP